MENIQKTFAEGMREIMPDRKPTALALFNQECLGAWAEILKKNPGVAIRAHGDLLETMRQNFIDAWGQAEPGIYYICLNTFTGQYAGQIKLINSKDRMFMGAPYNSIGFCTKTKPEGIF